MTKGLNVHGYTMLQVTHDPAIAAKAKKYVFDRLAEGRFVPRIARTFSLHADNEALPVPGIESAGGQSWSFTVHKAG